MLIAPPPVAPQVTVPLPAAMPVILPQGAPATARLTQAAIAGTPMASQVTQDQRSPSPAMYMGSVAAASMQAQEEEASHGRQMLATHLRRDGRQSVMGSAGAKAYGRAEERMHVPPKPEDESPIEEITA